MSHPTPRRHAVLSLLLATSLAQAAACRAGSSGASSATRSDPAAVTLGYAPARWRLASFEELNRTALWVSHIVIRHAQVNANDPAFRVPGWQPDPPPPTRTRAQALQLALKLADRAAADPSAFEQLAREHSEDVVTKEQGGSLGGVRAGQLPSEYRDALAVLKPGAVSEVIETQFGFHILKRRPLPADAQVSGRRIAIRYQGTVGGPRGAPSARSRADALRIAHEVEAQLKAGIGFEALVAKYSDSVDAAQQGDLGVFSTRDPEFMPREVERLAQLALGEVSEPIDSVFGFELLQRTPLVPRMRYAMSFVGVRYDPNVPAGHALSRTGAERLAAEIAAQLAKDPTQFEALRAEHCCEGEAQWLAGRGPIGVDPALDPLAIGEVAKAPVEANWFFMIPKRLDPAALPSPKPVLYELPSPRGPDFDALLTMADGPDLARYTRAFSDEAARALALAPEQAARFTGLLETLAASFERTVDPLVRVQRFHATLPQLRALLGKERYAQFELVLDTWGTRLLVEGNSGLAG